MDLNITDKENILQNFIGLSTLSQTQIEKLSGICHHRHYKAEELVYNYGTCAAVYLILQGTVALYKRHLNQVNRFHVVEKGRAFGFEALDKGAERSHLARACEPCETLVFLNSDIEDLFTRDPWLARRFYCFAISSLCYELDCINEGYIELTHRLIDSDIIV